MHPSKVINMYFATHRTCNLNCSYCYIPPEDRNSLKDNDRLILDSLDKFIGKTEDEGYAIGSFWLHGTQPSLMKRVTMAEIILKMNRHWKRQNIHGKNVSIQSNGTRLDKAYLSEILEITGDPGKLKIGFSIDPPKALHDKYRNNSYDKVIRNFYNAMDMGFPVSVLSVVTGETTEQPDEFGEWMKSLLSLKKEKGNPYRVKIKLASGEMSPNEAQIEALSAYLAENDLLKLAQILSQGYCVQSGNECLWFEFDINGNCYSCNKTYGGDGVFPDWMNEPFDIIINKRKKLFSEVLVNKECLECMYEFICNAGCPVDRHKEGAMAGKAHECTMIKYAYGYLEQQGIHIVDFFNNNY